MNARAPHILDFLDVGDPQYALENYTDDMLVAATDGELLMQLQLRWLAENRQDFIEAFEGDGEPDWETTARQQRAKLRTWMAGEIRRKIEASL